MHQGTECTNVNERGEECNRPIYDGSPLSLCQLHLMLAAEFAGELQMGRRGPSSQRRPGVSVKHSNPSVVYYIEFGDRIKIGTSRNLPGRLKDLTYDRLLAIEPGNHAVEHMRHLEFAAHRVNGEWFTDNGDLRTHIDRLVTTYGDPRSAYAQWVLSGPAKPILSSTREASAQ